MIDNPDHDNDSQQSQCCDIKLFIHNTSTYDSTKSRIVTKAMYNTRGGDNEITFKFQKIWQ